jgi:hypothetical protein
MAAPTAGHRDNAEARADLLPIVLLEAVRVIFQMPAPEAAPGELAATVFVASPGTPDVTRFSCRFPGLQAPRAHGERPAAVHRLVYVVLPLVVEADGNVIQLRTVRALSDDGARALELLSRTRLMLLDPEAGNRLATADALADQHATSVSGGLVLGIARLVPQLSRCPALA